MSSLPIKDYDSRSVPEILNEISGLGRAELVRLRNYEMKTQNRGMIIEAINAELRGPMDGYYSMSSDEIIERLDNYCKKDLLRILNYEEHHKTRSEIMQAIHERMPHLNC